MSLLPLDDADANRVNDTRDREDFETIPTVVICPGTHRMLAGFGGDDTAGFNAPPCLARARAGVGSGSGGAITKANQQSSSDFYALGGDAGQPEQLKYCWGAWADAMDSGCGVDVRWPLSTVGAAGGVLDEDDLRVGLHGLLHRVFYDRGIGSVACPDEHGVLLSERPMNPKENRERVLELLFDEFGTPAASLQNENLLQLLSSGRTSGVVVDLGHEHACAVAFAPVADEGEDGGNQQRPRQRWGSEPAPSMVAPPTNIAVTGSMLDCELWQRLQHASARQNGHQPENVLASPADFAWVQDAKRTLKSLEEGNNETTFTLPDNSTVTLPSGEHLAEALFDPACLQFATPRALGGNVARVFPAPLPAPVDSLPLADAVAQAIEAFPGIDVPVLLNGCTSMFKGLDQSLQTEIESRFPEGDIKFIAAPERNKSDWIGGSILASLSNSAVWILKEDYDEYGPSILSSRLPGGDEMFGTRSVGTKSAAKTT